MKAKRIKESRRAQTYIEIMLALAILAVIIAVILPRFIDGGECGLAVAATDWNSLRTSNISYFVGLGASDSNPNMILSGDRDIAENGRLLSAPPT